MNRQFTDENIQMSNKHTKRCSTSLAIRKMKIMTTIKQYYLPNRMDKIKNSDNTRCRQLCVEKMYHSCIAGGNVKWHIYSEKTGRLFIIQLNLNLPHEPTIALFGIYPRVMQT